MTRIFTLLVIGVLAQTCQAQVTPEATPPANGITPELTAPANGEELSLTQKASRLIAYSYFNRLAKQGADLDLDQIREGARMAFAREEIGMSHEEIQSVGMAFDKMIREQLLAKRKAVSEANIAEAEAFFAENKTREGVIEMENGVQYKVLAEGEGPLATATDRVLVRYQGRLIDGTVFDETGEGPPARHAVSGVVRGMTQVLLKMNVGSKMEAYLPSAFAYGPIGPRDPNTGQPIMNSPIGPDSALIYKMELIEILKPEGENPGE